MASIDLSAYGTSSDKIWRGTREEDAAERLKRISREHRLERHAKAEDLADRFAANFTKFTGNPAGAALVDAGPKK